jgi:hypothetical protein
MIQEEAVLSREFDGSFIRKLRRGVREKLGYSVGERAVPEEIEKTLDDAVAAIEKYTVFRVIYRVLPVGKIDERGIHTKAGMIKSDMLSRLARQCKGKRFAAFMVATLGGEYEGIGDARESLTERFVFDMAGSECIEMAADVLEAEWKKGVKSRGFAYSLRFSPGYCDWPLEGQAVIFNALDAGRIGVRLTPYSVMIPKKSISAVALMAEEVPVVSPCVFCRKEDCPWRRGAPDNEDKKLVR